MALNNDNDWELIRQEMESVALEHRFERFKNKHALYNKLFLGLFPKHMRNKVVDIEERICIILLIAFFLFIFYKLIFH